MKIRNLLNILYFLYLLYLFWVFYAIFVGKVSLFLRNIFIYFAAGIGVFFLLFEILISLKKEGFKLMKKIMFYLIIIVITYFISAYVNNKDLREKIQIFIHQKILRTQKIEIMYIKPKFTYVRKEASDNAALLGSLKRGTQIKVLKTQREWSFIETPSGVSGWVKYEVLTSTPVIVKESEEMKNKSKRIQSMSQKNLTIEEKISSQPLEIIEAMNLVPSLDEPPEIIKEEIKKQQQKKEEKTEVQTKPKPEESQKQSFSQKEDQKENQQVIIKEELKKDKEIKSQKTKSIEEKSQEYTKCGNCGAEVIKGERFCPYCREPISK